MKDEVKEIISYLRDNKFGNENTRKDFIDKITTLFNISDGDARKFIKKLGDACTVIGKEMIEDNFEDVDVDDSVDDSIDEDSTDEFFNYNNVWEIPNTREVDVVKPEPTTKVKIDLNDYI